MPIANGNKNMLPANIVPPHSIDAPSSLLIGERAFNRSKPTTATSLNTDNDDEDDEDLPNNNTSKSIYHDNINKRRAQDALILAQLRSGILPESFISNGLNTSYSIVDLSHYGIGDKHGQCLVEALGKLNRLGVLCLSDNRLNSQTCHSIVNILHFHFLEFLDLSNNNLSGIACHALLDYLRQKSALLQLNISATCLLSSDMEVICRGLIQGQGVSQLKELLVGKNKLNALVSKTIAQVIASHQCSLQAIDLSWNDFDSVGATDLSNGLANNISLLKFDLSANSIEDLGGQQLAASLSSNKTLTELDLSQCNIGSRSCFVFARVS